MRRLFVFATLFLTFCLLLTHPFDAAAKDKKKAKGVILSTVDIDEEYEILGLVYYKSSKLDPKIIHSELRKQAERMGADYVVGVAYYNNAGYLYGTGTAVRLIEEDASED
jgi:hypothetical protein